jgi:hypothetical protein
LQAAGESYRQIGFRLIAAASGPSHTFLYVIAAADEGRDGRGESIMAKYGKLAQKKVKRAMQERKRGKLKSGRSGKRVTSRKQAIAIGLSEARRAGGKVPKRKRG